MPAAARTAVRFSLTVVALPKLGCLLLIVLACAAAPAFAAQHTVLGEARDPASGNLLCREHHLIRSEGGRPVERLVLYRCPDGVFARKRIDYGSSAFALQFALEDVRRGYRAGLRREAGQLLV